MLEVDRDALEQAAKELSATACDIGGVDPAPGAEGLTSALAGARTAPAAMAVALRLSGGVQVYATRVTQMSEAAAGCASAYLATDDECAARFARLLQ